VDHIFNLTVWGQADYKNRKASECLPIFFYPLITSRYVERLGEKMPPLEKTDLLQGTLDMLILKVVALGPIHGYGISQRIRQISNEVLNVPQGSLYPALHRLEKRGWVTAEWGQSENGREAKFYQLSRQGRKQLHKEEETWERLAEAVRLILGSAPQEG
jgi:PadR family transcriptional regulator PadR